MILFDWNFVFLSIFCVASALWRVCVCICDESIVVCFCRNKLHSSSLAATFLKSVCCVNEISPPLIVCLQFLRLFWPTTQINTSIIHSNRILTFIILFSQNPSSRSDLGEFRAIAISLQRFVQRRQHWANLWRSFADNTRLWLSNFGKFPLGITSPSEWSYLAIFEKMHFSWVN